MMDGHSLSKITQGVTTEIMSEARTPTPYNANNEDSIGFSAFAQRIPEWIPRIRPWLHFGGWLKAMEGVSKRGLFSL
jgi:hypothetical protein